MPHRKKGFISTGSKCIYTQHIHTMYTHIKGGYVMASASRQAEVVKALSRVNIQEFYNYLLETSEDFKKFVNDNKDLSTRELAAKYKVDLPQEILSTI